MKQIWLLTKVQLGTALDFNLFNKSKKSKKRKMLMIAGTTAFLLLLSVVAFFYCYAMGLSLKMVGMLKVLPELIMAVTCVITMITTIYKVKGTLFGFKDYDLIMSLPVKTSYIIISRLLLLYIINIVFTLIIMVPASIAYGMLSPVSPYFYIISAPAILLIPLVPMIAATVFGTFIAVLSSRFRHNNLVHLLITFVFLCGIMVLSFSMGDSEKALGEMGAVINKQVDGIYPLAKMYRMAVCEFDLVSIVLFFVISLASFFIFSWIVGIYFKGINTALISNKTSENYKLGRLKEASPFMALYQKELKRFFSSSLYVLNTAFGIVMMTIGAVATLFMSKDALAKVMDVPQMAEMIGAFVPAMVSMCVAFTFTTACSISLEGRNLWILKASPVPPGTIFNSKIAVCLTLTLPAVLINGIIIAIGFKLSLADFIILLLMPAAYAFFTAITGLLINLKLPNLNWTTEVTVIKQSAAAMAATFLGMFVVAIPVILILVFPGIPAIYINSTVSVIISLITVLLYRFLSVNGSKIFEHL